MITIPYLTALTTYFSYGLLFAFGQLRDFFRKIIDWWQASNLPVLLCFIVIFCFYFFLWFYFCNWVDLILISVAGVCSDLLRTGGFLYSSFVSSYSGVLSFSFPFSWRGWKYCYLNRVMNYLKVCFVFPLPQFDQLHCLWHVLSC